MLISATPWMSFLFSLVAALTLYQDFPNARIDSIDAMMDTIPDRVDSRKNYWGLIRCPTFLRQRIDFRFPVSCVLPRVSGLKNGFRFCKNLVFPVRFVLDLGRCIFCLMWGYSRWSNLHSFVTVYTVYIPHLICNWCRLNIIDPTYKEFCWWSALFSNFVSFYSTSYFHELI